MRVLRIEKVMSQKSNQKYQYKMKLQSQLDEEKRQM